MSSVLMVPGLGGAGLEHWQSAWRADLGVARTQPLSWELPDLDDWVEALDRAVRESAAQVLVAHSLGCLTVAHWLARRPVGLVRAAMLVAPPDPSSAQFPVETSGFESLPPGPLPVRTVVVPSDNDPYCTPAMASQMSQAWGATWHPPGKLGHISSASGLGAWPQGWAVLQPLLSGRS